MRGWYVAKSKPRKETWLEAVLPRLGVDVYFPRVMGRRHGKQVLEPLFPTYLFCRFDSESSDWPAIRWASGLNYFLSADGRPSVIPDDLVEYINRRVNIWNDGGDTAQKLASGDQVTIGSGPFRGLEGIFQGYISSGQRCRILLQVVGRLTSVQLDERDLAVALPRL